MSIKEGCVLCQKWKYSIRTENKREIVARAFYYIALDINGKYQGKFGVNKFLLASCLLDFVNLSNLYWMYFFSFIFLLVGELEVVGVGRRWGNRMEQVWGRQSNCRRRGRK